MSARNVIEAIDKDLYVPYLIGITKKGEWLFGNYAKQMLEGKRVELSPQLNSSLLPDPSDMQSIDVFFPVLHGPYGEDGTIQGMLKLLGTPFVGSSVIGSAVSMDKDIMKRLFMQAGLPVVKWLALTLLEKEKYTYNRVAELLGPVVFVKPANLGSSVGVHKVRTAAEYKRAVDDAFCYDTKILLEQGIEAREIECAILGNDRAEASLLGEIIPSHEFYSYESKYLDENGARMQIPAGITKEQEKEIQQLAIKAFELLECQGLSRVDFFLDKRFNKIFLNEVNTIPGFTNISMYPKLWEASGISYTQLITRLIELGMARHEREAALHTSR